MNAEVSSSSSSSSSSPKKNTRKSCLIELKSEPTIVSELKLKAFDLNRRQESGGAKLAKGLSKSKNSSNSDLAKIEAATAVTVKSGVESENSGKTSKRKNATSNASKSQDQANKEPTAQKASKASTSKKASSDVNNNTTKKSNVNAKSKKNANAASKSNTNNSLSLVNPIESTHLNGVASTEYYFI